MKGNRASTKKIHEVWVIHKNTIASVAIILSVGLLSFTWFRGDFLITGGDMLLPPNRWQHFIRSFYSWDASSLGGANTRILAEVIPYNTFLVLSESVGLSLVNTNKLWFYLMFTSAGLSMYFLTTIIIGSTYKHFAGIISAVFYMMNPYAAIYLIPQFWIHVVFLPLIMGLYIKGLKEQKKLKYIFLISAVWVLVGSAGYVNPKFALLHWAALFLYMIFNILVKRDKEEVTQSLRFTCVLLVVWVALNAYWMFPAAFTLNETLALPLNVYGTIGITRLASYQLNSAPIYDAVRLMGFWALDAIYKGFPYYYWAQTYKTALFIGIGFIIPILAFASLLSKPRKKDILFFGIVTIVGLFIMSGAYPPFGFINVYLVTHVPFASDVLSTPYQIGGMYVVLGYAFLLGYAISIFYDRISRIKLRFLAHSTRILGIISVGFLIFLIVGVYAFPLWTGEVIYSGNEIIAAGRFNIPDYYYDAGNWLNAQPDEFRILPLPYSIVGYGAYTWQPKGFNGPDPTESILQRSVISSISGEGIGLYVAKSIASNTSVGLPKMLALMNAKYVLFHRDANWEFLEGNEMYVPVSLDSFQSIIRTQSGFCLENSYGELDFYRNEFWRPLYVYAAPNAQLVEGGLDEMIPVVRREGFLPGETVLFLTDQLDTQQISALSTNSSPHTNSTGDLSVIYEKITPTLYSVYVNVSQPFFLVFSESYHEGWTATIDGQQIPKEYHYMANGFANSWYISKTGSYTITLEFWPQRLFYIGAAISITTLILCTIYLSKDKVKTIYKQYAKKNIPQDLQRQSDDASAIPEDLKV